MNMLEISRVKKRFGEKEVLKDVSFCVPEHSVFGFIGQNGAGKTTTMKLILGLLKADSGDIRVAGEEAVYGPTKTNQYIGYLPDVPEFYPYMTAKEYLKFCGEITGMDAKTIGRRSYELLELVGLLKEKHRIGGYSRGMKQRLGIAQALLNQPKLLICDEPTSALDPAGRKEILDILSVAKEKTTILFSTHILSDVERISTDIACLHSGRVAFQGTLSQIRQMHPANGFSVEMSDSKGASQLLENIDGGCRNDDTHLTYQGNVDKIYEIMQYISEKKLKVQKIEQLEPTLESLFLEVIGK